MSVESDILKLDSAREETNNLTDKLLRERAITMEYKYKEMEEENKRLRQELNKNTKPVSLKVSEKGCVQVNGIRRFPIALYANEWEQIIEIIPQIKEFIEDNKEKLAKIN